MCVEEPDDELECEPGPGLNIDDELLLGCLCQIRIRQDAPRQAQELGNGLGRHWPGE